MHSAKNIQEWKFNLKTPSTICPCAQHAVRCVLFVYMANDVLGDYAAVHLEVNLHVPRECDGSSTLIPFPQSIKAITELLPLVWGQIGANIPAI